MYLLSLGVAALVPTLSISITTSMSVFRHFRSEIEASAQSLDLAVAQETTRFLENSRSHLDSFTNLPIPETPLREIEAAMNIFAQSHAEVSRITFLDRELMVTLVSPPDPSAIGDDLSGMAVLERPRKEAEALFSRAFLSPADGSVAVSIAKATPDGHIFLIQLNLSSLSDYLEPLLMNEKDAIAILDDAGRFIAHTDGSFVREQRYETRIPAGDSELIPLKDEKGIRWFASSRDIPDTPWRVVYYRNATEAFSVLPDVLSIVAAVTLICLAAATVFGIRLWGWAKSIFEAFVRQVEEVAAGRYDLKVAGTYAEFSALSSSIETMASTVSSRETELRAAISERDTLLKEVHHRVKNNMQIMISLLNLESRGISDAATSSIFIASMDRIRAMSLIHETLYGQGHLDSIELNEYTRRLAAELSMVHESRRVAMDLGAARIVVTLDQTMPYGLILNELLTNAFKYGLADGGDGVVAVQLWVEGGMVSLSVCDGGPGLNDAAKEGSTKGLGMQLIHSLTEQLGGTIAFVPRERGTGLRAVLRFPYTGDAESA